eukprot:scaffold111694_cov66-Phaeocystis_antarctica.AAC.5
MRFRYRSRRSTPLASSPSPSSPSRRTTGVHSNAAFSVRTWLGLGLRLELGSGLRLRPVSRCAPPTGGRHSRSRRPRRPLRRRACAAAAAAAAGDARRAPHRSRSHCPAPGRCTVARRSPPA